MDARSYGFRVANLAPSRTLYLVVFLEGFKLWNLKEWVRDVCIQLLDEISVLELERD